MHVANELAIGIARMSVALAADDVRSAFGRACPDALEELVKFAVDGHVVEQQGVQNGKIPRAFIPTSNFWLLRI